MYAFSLDFQLKTSSYSSVERSLEVFFCFAFLKSKIQADTLRGFGHAEFCHFLETSVLRRVSPSVWWCFLWLVVTKHFMTKLEKISSCCMALKCKLYKITYLVMGLVITLLLLLHSCAEMEA